MKHKLTAMRLQTAMCNAEISQRELSQKAHINEASVSQYINGSHAPSNVSAGKMADVLKVSPVWLMGFDVPMTVEVSKSSEQALNEQARRIATYYMMLSPASQKAIKDLTDLLYEKEKDAE